jgi:putative phage-type endonuclease
MKTHALTQGSAAWLAYRATHFNASDAPAMLGMSPYKTRTELLHELHTGLSPEVDAHTQARFDAGHRFEALARPLAEKFIGMELYPVTGSEGKLSASFDGLTMCETTAFEHKTLNAELRTAFDTIKTIAPAHRDQAGAAELPPMYRAQMEQQLMVSGADRCLFMASSWDGDDLVEERHTWYHSDTNLRAAILQGWTQFAIDLAAFVPAATEVKPVGRTPETLPALHIEVTGMVTASNLAEYKAHALAVFGSINRELVTDQDFASAESTVKWCGDIERRLAAAKQHALGQTVSIDALFRALDEISAEAKATRLELDKLVKNRKDSIRGEIVSDGRNALADHMAALTARIGAPLMPAIPVDFAAAIKGKRTLDSLRDAVAVELARAKIAANELADMITLNLRAIHAQTDFGFLFSDVATLVLKSPEFVAMVIKNRVADHRVDEAARLESSRASAEAIASAQAIEPKPAPAPVFIAPVAIEPVAATSPFSPPTLRLGQICERLGFTLTADFMRQLGFEPAATDKAAKLYHDQNFPRICAVLVRHIQQVAQGVEA